MAARNVTSGDNHQVANHTMARRMVLASLTRRRSRVLIAVAAVAIGATALGGLATIAADIPRHLSRELREVGANLVVSPAGDQPGLADTTLQQVDQALAGRQVVAQAAFRYQTVRLANQSYLAAGADLNQVQQAKGYWAVQGEWPAGPGQVLLGTDVAAWAGAEVGQNVTVSLPVGQEGAADEAAPQAVYTVSGIVTAGGAEDEMVVLWADDLAALAGPGPWDVAEYSVASESKDLAAIAQAISQAVPQVQAEPVQRLARSEADVLAMLRTLLALVATLVLALTMIGVSTTMVAVVTERRVEIALRKALGADQAVINREFVTEALVLGLVGGLAGVGLGYAFAWGVGQAVFHRSVQMPWWVALATVAVAIAVTRLGVIVPLRRTAQIDPALQLREE
ncbi:MAG: FtsX-like permease family protein [Bifidobacteriaceae bacterium]|jgi:putative ABC transport system permease protein|nr:FtsX-like permease family protein [Bifidobacteriaceae bacterium]